MRFFTATSEPFAVLQSGISARLLPPYQQQKQKEFKRAFLNLLLSFSYCSKIKFWVNIISWIICGGITNLFTTRPVLAQPSQSSQPRPTQVAVAPAVTPSIPKANCKISGIVLHDAAPTPVAFAAVALMDLTTGKTVDSTLADNKGKFSLVRVANGEYELTITFLGYKPNVTEIIIKSNKVEVNVGAITLISDAKTLKEVSVPDEEALVEDQVTRMVYSVEKDITNVGGTASEVLQKVPGSIVDLEGNVALRGAGQLNTKNQPCRKKKINNDDAKADDDGKGQ